MGSRRKSTAARSSKSEPSSREAKAPEPEPVTSAANAALFPIVGVGASAGGLEAFTQMLGALPVDTGMAFVLVQHLAPTRPSLLSEILSRTTAMPVLEVQDEARVEPDHVYVIPPDCSLVLAGGALQLLPRQEARGQHRPIDLFFRSLAEHQKHRAIGVILSGTASDGTLGLEEIKAEGGITFAQDDTAQQDSMPRSAVASGCVDFVLPPDEIAREIGRIARHPYVSPAEPVKRKTAPGEPDLGKILETVRRGTGVDFSQYKSSTLYRRITRRMVVNRKDGLQEYARFLRKNPEEVATLYQDILINVTSFFRGPETFEALRTKFLPKLLKDRSRHEPLRVWVPGCSTGEEAYSIAITCAEVAEARGTLIPVQIFATDLNGAGIDKARAGVFSKSIEHDVSPERLRRFFEAVDGRYRIAKLIRDLCVFARHNVLTDPPFSQIDLISCRNLLIYLEPALQHKVVPLLHYALKPTGLLLLGSSETIGSYRDLFEVEDARHKIYAKRPGAQQVNLGPVSGRHRSPGEPGIAPSGLQPAGRGAEVQKEADRILLAKYAPPGVLCNSDLEILQFRGDTGPYLAPSPGRASLNVLRMAREGLQATLRSAVNRARKQRAAVRHEGAQLEANGGFREVNLEVVPVKAGSTGEGGFLILFEEPGPPRAARGKSKAPRRPPGAPPEARAGREAAAAENVRLTQELAAAREYLQSVIEQQEAANEELQSANEEAQSANEELQSINEELETSKEEIQSTNEELATVNDELQNRNQELNGLNSDLVNLLASVDMAIVMLGRDLRIRRFTPVAGKLFNLIPTDVGRPVGDIKLNFDISDLEALLEEVIDSVSVKEREVRDRQGRWYSLRIRPYRSLDHKIDGAVVLLVDVDTLRRAREFAESIVDTVRESLVVLDSQFRIKTASRSFHEAFQVTRGDSEGLLLFDLPGGPWDHPKLRSLLSTILQSDKGFDDFEVKYETGQDGARTLMLNARRLVQENGRSPLILLAIEDVTLRQYVQELAAADRSKNEFLALLAHELRNPLAPLQNAVQVLENPGAEARAIERAREMLGRQVQNMARLIDDLLDVSRITQGKIRLRMQPIGLATALASAVELARQQIESRGQEVSLSLPQKPVELDADPTRLEQIFGNLLNNASKFTPQGGHVWVTAELVNDGSQAPEVVVAVRDEGIGMTPETLARAFDLFMQADRSLDRARGGLGIGLTLARRLVELHGGTVEAHSAGPGHGSELVVRLPVSTRESPGPAAEADKAPTAAADGGGPRRVLVVDDNVDMAESLAILLRLRGHEVELAFDGLAALEAARAFEPEVVLLDIGLPGLDGYQVAAALRKRRRTAKALLVALTGYGQEEDQRRARESGFDHHLTKPVDPQLIYELLSHPDLR